MRSVASFEICTPELLANHHPFLMNLSVFSFDYSFELTSSKSFPLQLTVDDSLFSRSCYWRYNPMKYGMSPINANAKLNDQGRMK
nr:MAG: hypothetical protein AM325_11665 [Candidatus Thorarchaeota archaeon SMTZ1-45]